MNDIKCVFIRNSFDVTTLERDEKLYQGKLLNYNPQEKTSSYAFKLEDGILRMKVTTKEREVFVEQIYADSTSKMSFLLNEETNYKLTLNNGYTLEFILKATEVKVIDFNVQLKYNLIDKNTKEVISLHEIQIKGDEVC